MGENTCETFWEFLGISKDSNFEGELSLELVGIFGNPKKLTEMYWNSLEFPKIPENLCQFG